MIRSYINGEYISTEAVTEIYDVDGNLEDSVYFFDYALDKYSSGLLTVASSWRQSAIIERVNALRNLKAKLEDEHFAETLARAISKEIGKPMCEAETEVSESIGVLDYFINNVDENTFLKKVELDPYWETKKNFIKLQPLGIVGIIKPWNYPVSNSLWSIIPAILAGNVVIYKPSEYSCMCAKLLSEAIIDSGLPTGVFNIIYGDKNAGERIVECKEVSMISFTGGSGTAQAIQLKSAQMGIMRKFSIESGGSDFAIIDKDADLQFVLDGIVWGAFNNSGQVCTSVENVLLPAEMRGGFIDGLKDRINALKQKSDYGKIQNKRQLEKISGYLKSIKDDVNYSIMLGGEIKDGYLSPTVIECKNIESAGYEIFGNIIRLFYYYNEADIPQLVNSSGFGLGCTIWTSEPESTRINKLIDSLQVGMVWVNDVNIAFSEMPWTGVKNSGVGFNLSLDSIGEFSSLKSVSIDTNTKDKKDWWFPYGDNT